DPEGLDERHVEPGERELSNTRHARGGYTAIDRRRRFASRCELGGLAAEFSRVVSARAREASRKGRARHADLPTGMRSGGGPSGLVLQACYASARGFRTKNDGGHRRHG